MLNNTKHRDVVNQARAILMESLLDVSTDCEYVDLSNQTL